MQVTGYSEKHLLKTAKLYPSFICSNITFEDNRAIVLDTAK